jgi:hypothetical protein
MIPKLLTEKMCPRCHRELTIANVMSERKNDGDVILLICDCGYLVRAKGQLNL